jgi:hypothetical protein
MFEGKISKHSRILLVLTWKNNPNFTLRDLNVTAVNGFVSIIPLKSTVQGNCNVIRAFTT